MCTTFIINIVIIHVSLTAGRPTYKLELPGITESIENGIKNKTTEKQGVFLQRGISYQSRFLHLSSDTIQGIFIYKFNANSRPSIHNL